MSGHPTPRLMRLMIWCAILSDSEATACLRDYRANVEYSSEAVNSYGGPRAVIERAVQLRTNYSLRRSLSATRATAQRFGYTFYVTHPRMVTRIVQVIGSTYTVYYLNVDGIVEFVSPMTNNVHWLNAQVASWQANGCTVHRGGWPLPQRPQMVSGVQRHGA